MGRKVSKEHKSYQELEKELEQAEKLVKIGGVYFHFKNPENLYRVIDLGFQEATNEVCVIYKAEYAKKFTFVRNLKNWLEKPSKDIERFKQIK